MVSDAVSRAGVDPDKFVAFANFHRAKNTDRLAAATLGANTGIEKCLHIGQCGAVQNGQFQVIQLRQSRCPRPCR